MNAVITNGDDDDDDTHMCSRYDINYFMYLYYRWSVYVACIGFKTVLCIGRFSEASHLSLLLKCHHHLDDSK